MKILCKEIIITDETAFGADFNSHMNDKMKFTDCSGKTVYIAENVEENDDLYELCLALADFVCSSAVKNDIEIYLAKNYTCFNSEETEMIVSEVMTCAELKEMAGRMFLFLRFQDSIEPNAFYRFRCGDIKEAVLRRTDEEAENVIAMDSREEFIRLMRYFASMSTVACESVDLVAADDGIRLINPVISNGGFMEELGMLDSDADDAFTDLVALNPQRITIHGREYYEKQKRVSYIINSVFGERIVFCGGCDLCTPKKI